MKVISLIWVLFILPTVVSLKAQQLQVSQNGRFLVSGPDEPFFWLADTAWELFHRCSLDDIRFYLTKRKQQGFNVIQAVALAELDGLNTPNVYGAVPLTDNDPKRPNEEYFDYVEEVVDLADSMGMYIALLPTWGDKLFRNTWGLGPEIFNPENARFFGEWMGSRFGAKDNIIWVLGGDRNPRDNHNDVEVWRSMAQGIIKGAGTENILMTFHPQPHQPGGSSTWFHHEKWLDFNMHQTGHCPNQGTYRKILYDY